MVVDMEKRRRNFDSLVKIIFSLSLVCVDVCLILDKGHEMKTFLPHFLPSLVPLRWSVEHVWHLDSDKIYKLPAKEYFTERYQFKMLNICSAQAESAEKGEKLPRGRKKEARRWEYNFYCNAS